MTERGDLRSPCIQVCILDPETRMCTGCLRTIEEITDWIDYTDDQRTAILGELPGRRCATALRGSSNELPYVQRRSK